jgi:hypothetical protein
MCVYVCCGGVWVSLFSMSSARCGHKTNNRTEAALQLITSVISMFMYYCHSQIFQLSHISEDFIIYFYLHRNSLLHSDYYT